MMRASFLALLAVPALLSACGSVPSPISDPRTRGPFMPQSQMPLMPNIARIAPSEGCQGEPLSAVNAPLPEYPARGWARGEQGWSIVQFDVVQSGAVENVRIAQGVPGRFFDREARRAVEQWQFAPLSEGARLTGCTVMFEFVLGQVRIR
ncbi:MAG: energy transducer TonB [Caulobacterales bacterium]|uniref:energy transducer TonB n=1 Tax=Glycocaulis sp. TaxID=1969725 RepID=UPI003FA0BE0C